MKTVSKNIHAVHTLLAGLALAVLIAPGVASAADPQLEKAIQQGHELFSHATFDGNGHVCESCHLAGGASPGKLPNGKAIPSLANAAAIFPRFRAKDNKVIVLADQVRSCIAGGLGGNPPAYGSEQLNSIISYITSLSEGKPIEMGGQPR